MVEPLVRFICATEGTREAVFFDKNQLEPGILWEETIERYIRKSSGFLLFWSQAASESEWVMKEIALANQLEKPMLPVRLDSTLLPGAVARFQALDLYDSCSNLLKSETGEGDSVTARQSKVLLESYVLSFEKH